MESQLFLPGLTPIKPFYIEFIKFFALLGLYFRRKIRRFFFFIASIFIGAIKLVPMAKFQITRKLIFGRGALGQPVSHLAVLALSIAILFTTSVLSGTPLVHAPSKVRASDFIQAPDVISAPTVSETLVSEYIRKESIKYTVKSGDTLSSIGTSFKITADALIYANSLDEDAVLRVGQELSIPPVDGIVHTVKRGDTVASLSKKFSVPEQSIIEFNYLFEPFTLKTGDNIVIPDAKIPPPPPKAILALPIPKGPVPSGTGQFLWPVQTRYITQYFTFYHNGIDIGGYSPIFATDGGRIVSAGWNPWGLGNAVKIDHGNGFTSTYGHLSRIDVYVGQDVGRGQVIGMTGNTGRSFGTHLHFIIQLAGKYVNPLSYL